MSKPRDAATTRRAPRRRVRKGASSAKACSRRKVAYRSGGADVGFAAVWRCDYELDGRTLFGFTGYVSPKRLVLRLALGEFEPGARLHLTVHLGAVKPTEAEVLVRRVGHGGVELVLVPGQANARRAIRRALARKVGSEDALTPGKPGSASKKRLVDVVKQRAAHCFETGRVEQGLDVYRKGLAQEPEEMALIESAALLMLWGTEAGAPDATTLREELGELLERSESLGGSDALTAIRERAERPLREREAIAQRIESLESQRREADRVKEAERARGQGALEALHLEAEQALEAERTRGREALQAEQLRLEGILAEREAHLGAREQEAAKTVARGEVLDVAKADLDAREAELRHRQVVAAREAERLALVRHELDEERQALEAERSALERRRQAWQEREAEAEHNLQQRLRAVASREAALGNAGDLQEKLGQASKAMVDLLRKQLQQERNESKRLQAELEEVGREGAAWAANAEALQGELAKEREEHLATAEELRLLRAMRSNLERESRRLEDVREALAREQEVLNEAHKEMSATKEALLRRQAAAHGLEKQLGHKQSELRQLQQRLDQEREELGGQRREVAAGSDRLGSQRAVLERATAECGQREAKLKDQEQLLANERLRATQDARDLRDKEQSLLQLHDAVGKLQKELNARADDLASLRTQLDGRAVELDLREAGLTERARVLDGQERQLYDKVEDLRAERATLRARQDLLEAQLRDVDARREELQKAQLHREKRPAEGRQPRNRRAAGLYVDDLPLLDEQDLVDLGHSEKVKAGDDPTA